LGQPDSGGSWAERNARSVLLGLGGVAMVALGVVITSLPEGIAIALIVVGAGLFMLALLLPVVSEFEIGPGGFSAKLTRREQALQGEGDRLAQLAGLLAGGEAEAEDLLRRAIAEAYLAREDPAEVARRKLVEHAPEGPAGAGAPPTDVLSTLRSMPPEERGATVLHLLEGVDPTEVARILRRPEEAVGPLIEKGIATLGRLAAEGASG
jgi:hypothetical protein